MMKQYNRQRLQIKDFEIGVLGRKEPTLLSLERRDWNQSPDTADAGRHIVLIIRQRDLLRIISMQKL